MKPRVSRTIVIPDAMTEQIDELITRYAERFGETPEDARRGVELTLVQRGIRGLGLAKISSRAWFEWHLRRTGRDPRKRRERLEPWIRDRVVSDKGMTCALCGGSIDSASDLHIDHIIPRARGGSDAIENLQPTHARCNLRKGSRLQ